MDADPVPHGVNIPRRSTNFHHFPDTTPGARLDQLHYDLEALLEQVRKEDRLAAEVEAVAAEEDAMDAQVSSEQEPVSDADEGDGSDVEIETAPFPLPMSESEPAEDINSPHELEHLLAAKMAVTDTSPAPELDLGIVAQPSVLIGK